MARRHDGLSTNDTPRLMIKWAFLRNSGTFEKLGEDQSLHSRRNLQVTKW